VHCLHTTLTRLSLCGHFWQDYNSKLHPEIHVGLDEIVSLKQKDSESIEQRSQRLLERFLNHSPSSLSRPSVFQDYAKDVISLSRPFVFDPIPITLLQKEFGEFQDDRTLLPSAEAQMLLLSLTEVMCKWHRTETTRRYEVQKVFSDVAGLWFHAETILGTEYTTDGNLHAQVMPAAIRECKNESGCALFESIAYYGQFLRNNLSPDARVTRFPCILLIDVGM
jgi:hypothetical protein